MGEAARRWLKNRNDLTPLAELLLFEAARTQLVEKVISPALASHQIVVCDRFYASTVAYQGYGRGLDLEVIQRLNQVAALGVRPDLTVLLDIPAEIGLARKRGGRKDSLSLRPWSSTRGSERVTRLRPPKTRTIGLFWMARRTGVP